MSTPVDLADAVVQHLNAAAFSQPFTATRSYLPKFNPEKGELDALRVTVVPRTQTIEIATRAEEQFTYVVDVAVQKKVDPQDLNAMDALITVLEEIIDSFRKAELEGLADAVWFGLENDPVYSREALDERRVFMSVVRVTYRLVR